MGRARLLLGISVFWLALSILFDGLNTLVLPKHLLGLAETGSGATMLGLVTFVGLMAGMLVQPVAGALSDRLRLRWGRLGTIGLGVLLVLPALALFGSTRSMLAVPVGYILIQVAASVAQAAQQAFIPDLVPTQWRGTAAGLKLFMDVGGAMLGFILLGQLLSGGGIESALLAIAAAVVLAFLLTVALVREPPFAAPAAHERFALADVFRLDLRRHRSFAWLVAARFLFLLGTYAVGRFFLLFVAERLGLDPGRAAQEAGTLLAGLTLVTVASAPPAGWAADRFGRARLMLVGAGLSALGVVLLATAGGALQVFLFGGLMALGSGAFSAANWALAADLAPPAEAARFLALANFGTAGAAAVAGLLGPLVDGVNGVAPGGGFPALFAAAALAFLISALAVRRVTDPLACQQHRSTEPTFRVS